MTTETKFRAGLTITLLGLIIMQFFYFENIRKFDEYKVSTTKQIDSLNDELFSKDVEIGRYELTFDHLNEKYPNISTEMENWKNHETE